MYTRSAAAIITRFSQIYPAIGITGPYQSGKSTLAKMLFPHLPYISFESHLTRSLAKEDINAFVEKYKNGAIFDEIQHIPELLSLLQELIDSDRENMGRFIITGSQNFALNQAITQSLAGRIGMLTLLPLTMNELNSSQSLNNSIINGGYPGLYKNKIQAQEFFPGYIETYLERDVKQLQNIENLTNFQRFIRLCAGRIGQQLNLQSLGVECGVTHTTIRRWLTILEASYIVYTIPPYYQNFNRRLVKMPKLYFYDTGIACSLLGIEKALQLDSHYIRGHLFENFIINELMKNRRNKGLPPSLYFWKDASSNEVDIIGEWSGTLHAVEIKMNSSFNTSFLKGIQHFEKISPHPFNSYIVYTGTESYHIQNTLLLPYKNLTTITNSQGSEQKQTLNEAD